LDATALPTGADVRHGSATVGTEGATMTINQSTSRATINWQSFNVGTDARVNVVQNNSQSVLLNRVVGNEMSQIRGQISANGQVVLVNPNGIVMGPTGRITASAFTASAFGITDANFEAGHMKYERNGSTGQIVHQGHIQTAEAGGYVALIGADVNNQGTITTRQGAVVLAAADAVTLPSVSAINNVSVPLSRNVRLELNPEAFGSANVSNSGVIVTDGGQVLMRAAAVVDAVSKVANATVVQSGSIDTTGAQGGGVDILADNGRIRVSGSVQANSTDGTAGGDVYIGRDENTNILAAVGDVRDAKLESKGGFVETSGQYLATDGVSVKAKDWLLDPSNITISTGNDAGYTDNSGTYTPDSGANTSVVKVGTIESAISGGTSVTITTTNTGTQGSGVGNITVKDALNLVNNSNQHATLKLIADNGIFVNANITGSTGTGSSGPSPTGLVNIDMLAKGVPRGNANSFVATDSSGIVVNNNIAINTNGTVKIDGTNNNTNANSRGITFNSGSSISAASFDIQGTATGIANGSHGVHMVGNNSFTSSSTSVTSQINGIAKTNGFVPGSSPVTFNGITAATNINGTVNFNAGNGSMVVKGSNSNSQLGVRVSEAAGGATIVTNGNVTLGALEPNSNFSMRAGSITANSGSLNILGSSVSNYGGESITAHNGVSINIEGKTDAGSASNAVSFTNIAIKALQGSASSAGNISITGTSSTGNAINFTPSVNIEGRNISLKGTATNGAVASGAAINGSGKITASGTLKIEGVSANTGGYSTLTNGPLQAAGDITIEGTGTAKHGVNLGNNVAGNTITSTGGKIEVLGTTNGAGGVLGSASGSAINGNAVITAEKDVTITGKTHGYYAINGLGNINSTTGNVTIDGYSRDSRGVNYDKTITATNGLIKIIGGSGVDGTVTSAESGAGSERGIDFSGVAKGKNVTFEGASINNFGTHITSPSGALNIDAAETVKITGKSTGNTGVNLGFTNGHGASNSLIKSGGDTSVTGTGVRGVNVWAGSSINAKNIDVVGTAVTRSSSEEGFGVNFERIQSTANFKSSEDIRIEGTLTGLGVGSGVKTSWRNQNGNAPTMNAGGNFTLRANNRALASNTNAAINADSGMQVTAGKNIVVQAETNNENARAMTFFSTGDNYRGNTSFVSTGGDVLVQANQGAIVFNNLQNSVAGQSTDIKGRNITFDNTGARMATGVGTEVGSGGTKGGTIGSGSINTDTGVMVLGAGKANAEAINFAQGRVINATGQLNIMGASKTSLGAQIFTDLTGGSVNIQGTSETGGGIYNTRKIESTTGGISMIGRTTTATGHSGITIQGEVKGKTDINLEGYSGNTNNIQGIIVGDKVTAETGTIKVTGETKAASQRAVAITQLGSKFGSLNTTDKDITVIGNTLLIAPGAAVNAGTGTVFIKTLTAGNEIVLGAEDAMNTSLASQKLGIDNAELTRITSAKLVIGDNAAAVNNGKITVGTSSETSSAASNGNIVLQTKGDIEIAHKLTIASGKTLTLNAGGSVTDNDTNGIIKADKLELLGDAAFNLDNKKQTVGTLAADVKSLVFTNGTALKVDTVNGTTGVRAKDGVRVTTETGNLSIDKAIKNTTSGNVVVGAGVSEAAGLTLLGDVKTTSGQAITTQAGGKTLVYTGSAAGSGLLSHLNSNFSDLKVTGVATGTNAQNTDTNFAFNNGSGISVGSTASEATAQVMFREKVTITNGLVGTTLEKTYGDTNTQNNPDDKAGLLADAKTKLKSEVGNTGTAGVYETATSGNVIKIAKSVIIDSLEGGLDGDVPTTYSNAGYLKANGDYAYNRGANTLISTKYNINNTTFTGAVKVTVAKKAITLSGATASDKVYDQTDTATLTNLGGLTDGAANKDDKKKFALDDVTVTITNAKFNDALVGDNKPITVVANLTGGDADNYTFVTPANLTARITGAVEPVDPPGPVVPVPVPTPNNNTVVVAGGNNSFQLAGAEAACSADTLNQCECETATNPEGVALEGIQICYEPNTRPSSAL
jgi:filamentous hemagglutinin family protein